MLEISLPIQVLRLDEAGEVGICTLEQYNVGWELFSHLHSYHVAYPQLLPCHVHEAPCLQSMSHCPVDL